MIQHGKLAFTAAGLALFAGSAFADVTPTLPKFGHYIGYGTVVAADSCPATETVGASFQNQLELNTPGETLVAKTRRVYAGLTPDFVPTIVLSRFEKTGGTHLAPSGAMLIRTEGQDDKVTGQYTATYTPLDPNSFTETLVISYTYTPPAGSPGTCNETTSLAYIRSSAD